MNHIVGKLIVNAAGNDHTGVLPESFSWQGGGHTQPPRAQVLVQPIHHQQQVPAERLSTSRGTFPEVLENMHVDYLRDILIEQPRQLRDYGGKELFPGSLRIAGDQEVGDHIDLSWDRVDCLGQQGCLARPWPPDQPYIPRSPGAGTKSIGGTGREGRYPR